MTHIHCEKSNTAPRLGWVEQGIFALLSFLMTLDYYLVQNDWRTGFIKSLYYTALPMGILYLNYYLLIPLFFQKRQFVRFALACMTCAMVYMAFQRWSGLEAFLCDEVSWQGLFSTAIDWALYLLLSTLLWYFRQFKLEREHQSLIRIEKLESELKFLRTQMNPHFIFNTLNNIYALALQNHPNAAPMVARLVDILRYVLYEGSAEKASLVQEIEVVRQFIEIHRLRNLQSKNIDFYIEGPAQGWKITPMLLLNFIENCFKYSDLDQDEEAWLRIEIDISQEGDFRFSAQNSLSADFTKTENDSPQGIGLKNARRQLELGYYKQHKLDISSTHDIFSVILTLQLEPLL